MVKKSAIGHRSHNIALGESFWQPIAYVVYYPFIVLQAPQSHPSVTWMLVKKEDAEIRSLLPFPLPISPSALFINPGWQNHCCSPWTDLALESCVHHWRMQHCRKFYLCGTSLWLLCCCVLSLHIRFWRSQPFDIIGHKRWLLVRVFLTDGHCIYLRLFMASSLISSLWLCLSVHLASLMNPVSFQPRREPNSTNVDLSVELYNGWNETNADWRSLESKSLAETNDSLFKLKESEFDVAPMSNNPETTLPALWCLASTSNTL